DLFCIDKSSSAELSEAINSMYNWYSNSACCYAFLSDLAPLSNLRHCRWFTRGWTLQELIAPQFIVFYDKDWVISGRKGRPSLMTPVHRNHLFATPDPGFERLLSGITGIPSAVLSESRDLSLRRQYSIAKIMSWAAHRRTTRLEDMAYCLLGLFNINMPLLYGEGEKAFIRLQEEIIKETTDLSLFAW
ncbi:hypothetical protein BDV96DRAFT_461546, partial [Lophiotrema nucula]